MSSDKKKDQKENQRKKRVPVGVRKASMTISDSLVPADCVPRYVNDVGDRLQRYLDGGYVFADKTKRFANGETGDDVTNTNTDMGSRVSLIVDKTARTNSAPVRAYLMYIKKELYNEDQANKMNGVDKIDAQLRTGLKDIKEDRGHFNADIKYEA